jgi:hypothetical protein
MRACWDANPDLRPSFPEVNLLLKDQYLLSMIDDEDYSYSTPAVDRSAYPASRSSSSPPERRSSRDEMLFAPNSQRNMNYGTYYDDTIGGGGAAAAEGEGNGEEETDALLGSDADAGDDDGSASSAHASSPR